MIDWKRVDTVFLDMDGTLLDLHFDDFFWREHVPRRFAEKEGMDLPAAKEEVYARYRQAQGTLQWYSLDHWTEELGLDIAILKEEVDHLIAVHPFVLEFLETVRSEGKRVLLLTNAHGKSVALKMKRTRLHEYLDGVLCAHDFGLPKEDPGFWERLRAQEDFNPERTLLVDDSREVLESAKAYGIRFLVTIFKPNTRAPRQEAGGFPAIDTFRELFPSQSPRANHMGV